MSSQCTHGISEHAGVVPESGLGDAKPTLKDVDLAKVEIVDTLHDLSLVDTDVGSSISDESESSENCTQREINLSLLDAAQVQEWCSSDYEMVKALQSAPSNQGRVDLMKSVQTGTFVAVKRMPNTWMKTGPTEFDSAYPESMEQPWLDIGIIKFLYDIGYSHVCEPWGVFSDGLHTYVVNSYACEGELLSWLDRDPAIGPEREAMARPIMRQFFSAVKWLHNLGVAHGDISLENVLMTDEGAGPIIKLVDFGMATLNRSGTVARGKKPYMAPEMYRETPFDVFATDAFAVGVCAFGVCCREYPWESTMPGECKLFTYVRQNGLQEFLKRRKVYGGGNPQQRLSEALSKPLLSLLDGLLQMTPTTRLTLGEMQENGQRSPSVWSNGDWLEAAQ